MAGAVERLEFLLSLNSDGAIKGFKAVGAAADKELGKAESKLDKVGGTMTKFGAAALAGAAVAGAGLFKAGEAASDLGESLSKTNVIFGASAAGVVKFAESAARNLGLSERAALDAASGFAQLGKAAGLTGPDLAGFSTELTSLSGDLASFSNSTPEEAVLALSAALRGESEPIRKYGVLLDDATLKAEAMSLGIYDGTGTLTQQQKVLAAHSSILKQTSDAQGDFARTSDGAANSQRIMKAEMENAAASLGQSVAPMIATVAKGVGKLAGAFTSANEATGGMIGKFAAFGTVGVGVVGALSSIAGQAIKMRSRFVEVGEAGEKSLTKTGKAAAGLGIAMGVAAAGVALYDLSQMNAKANAKGFTDALTNITRITDEQATKDIPMMIAAWEAFMHLSPEKIATKIATENLAAAIRVRDMAVANDELRGTLEKQGVTVGMLTKAIDTEVAAQKTATAATEKAQTATEGATEAVEAQTGANNIASGSFERMGVAVGEANQKLAATDAAIKLLDGTYSAIIAKLDKDDAWVALDASLDKTRLTMADVNATAEAQAEAWKSNIREMATYVKNSADIPTEIKTAILADIDQGSIDIAEAKLRALERTRKIMFEPKVGSLSGVGVNMGTGYASGTSSATPGLHPVGENGIEIVAGPGVRNFKGGETVFNARDTAAMLGGGSGTVINNFTINTGADPRQVIQIIKKYTKNGGTL